MSHIPTNHEISTFFSNITPDDVMKTPTQTHIRTVDDPADLTDDEEFAEFWMAQLVEYKKTGSSFTSLHDGETTYYYAHRPDESDWEHIERVSVEAEQVNAGWTFICYQGQAARGIALDASSPDATDQIKSSLTDCTLWYADSKNHDHVYGMIQDDDFIISSNPKGANPRFHDILKGSR